MEDSEKLKKLRKEIGVKQGEFANRISTTQGHISDIENGRKALSDRTIKLICLQTWNGRMVNEEWLRTGEGEMFCTVLEEDELATYCADICSGKDPFIANTILEYMRLEDNDRKAIRDFIKSIAKDL